MRSQGVAVDPQGEFIPASPRAFFNTLVDFHGKSVYRNYALVQYQLFAMYFEAYCGAILYGGQLSRLATGSFGLVDVALEVLQCTPPRQDERRVGKECVS